MFLGVDYYRTATIYNFVKAYCKIMDLMGDYKKTKSIFDE